MPTAFDEYTLAFAEFMESGQPEKLASYCDPDTNLDLFAIYRNGYLRAAIDTLASNYPAVHTLLGDENFRPVARQYVSKFPPVSGSLVAYGRDFANFLSEYDTKAKLPYLTDIAKLDRSWLQVYFAKATEVLTAQHITRVMKEYGTQGIQLITASAIVTLDYPVTGVWQKLKDHSGLKEKVELSRNPEHTLIWRQRSGVAIRPLPAAEFIFLRGLDKGLGLERAAENTVEEFPSFDLSTFFSNLISAELLSLQAAPNLEQPTGN